MDKIAKEAMKEKEKLVANAKTVLMSTVDSDGSPNVSYAPCLIDNSMNLYVYLSKLSKHTNNLLNIDKVSVMIIQDEFQSDNIFARKRFTMDCVSSVIDREENDWIEKMDDMEGKFGESIKFLRTLTDFYLFRFIPSAGLLVYDFGKAFRFVGKNLNDIVHLNEQGHTKN
tara:strand:+ start:1879 stop:2388 length:510 start_codon:yes stop_codon:yes gene_type:complete